MMVVILILNKLWRGRTTHKFINPDIEGLNINTTEIKITESNVVGWQIIPKSQIDAITIIFKRE